MNREIKFEHIKNSEANKLFENLGYDLTELTSSSGEDLIFRYELNLDNITSKISFKILQHVVWVDVLEIPAYEDLDNSPVLDIILKLLAELPIDTKIFYCYATTDKYRRKLIPLKRSILNIGDKDE